MNYYPLRLTDLDRLCFRVSFMLACRTNESLVSAIKIIQSDEFDDCFSQWAQTSYSDDLQSNIVGAEAA